MTWCVTSILNSLWAVAGAALAINAAATSCPPKDILTGSKHPNPFLTYKLPQAKCSSDITTILTGFLMMITYIENALIACTDTLDLQTICAEAITGLLAMMSRMGTAGAGLFLSCDKKSRGFQDLLKTLQKAASLIPSTTKAPAGGKKASSPGIPKMFQPEFPNGWKPGAAAENAADLNSGEPYYGAGFGRRLDSNMTESEQMSKFGRHLTDHEKAGYAQAERFLAEVQAQFATPQEAFASIGLDLNDKNAAYHEHAKAHIAETERQAKEVLASAVKGDTGSKASSPNIPEQCGGAR